MKLPVYRNLGLCILLLSSIGVHTELFSQNSRLVDSLETRLKASRNDQERMDISFNLFRMYWSRDNDLAYQYADRAYMLGRKLGDSLVIVQSLNAKGSILRDKGNLQEASIMFNDALDIAQRQKEMDNQVRFIINNQVLTYIYAAEYDKALDAGFKSLRLREVEGNPEDVSVACNNIGLTYFYMKDWENALTFYKRSYDIKVKNDVLHDLARCVINIGLIYNQLHEYDNALKSLKEAFKLCDSENCRPDAVIELHTALAQAYYGSNDYESAEQEAMLCIKAASPVEANRFLVSNYHLMARIRMQQGRQGEASAYLDDGRKELRSTNLRSLVLENYGLNAELYSKMEDYKQAAHYLQLYNVLKDSIYHEDLIKNIAKIQTSYEERENLKTIAVKDDLLQAQEEVIRRQERLNLAIAIIAILAGLLIFVLYRTNMAVRRANHALSQAKETIEDQNRQLRSINQELEERVRQRTLELSISNASLTRVNDELDNFIYKTSHDIRGPLASLKGICNVAIMDVKDHVALGYLQKLDITAERLNGILTRLLIINQINHASVNHVPIHFGSMVDEILFLERKKGIPDRLNIEREIGTDIEFSSDKEIVRIIVENLIDNAIKFYNDSSRVQPFVKIQVQDGEYEIRFRVIDNGIGIGHINPEKIFQMFNRASERSETGGIGLYLAKTAADKIGAKVGLKTTTEGFTEFFVSFPKMHNKVMARA